ncbi:hypothetical protein VTL71DRAFT_8895 [Oculimacula yallundae]|uniref:Peptidase A1 domain-containing protein n=1 Tax=Oculimacula yallundae TaxID=86028 RepID=A0ABR4BTB1_9HELO
MKSTHARPYRLISVNTLSVMLFPFAHVVCVLLLHALHLMASPSRLVQKGGLEPRIYGSRSGFSVKAVIAPPSNRSARITQRGNGVWVAADTDREWFIPIEAGTPPQTILLQPDTGAPDFSLMSTLIPVASRGEAPVYDPMKSSTAVQTPGMSWAQGYGDGSIFFTGVVYRDTITVGGLTVTNFEFEVCETSKSQPHRIPSFFPTIITWLDAPVFAVDFHKSTSTGTFDFGHIDRTKYIGDIHYTKEDEKANLCRSNLHEGGGWGKNIIELLFVVFDYGNKRVGLAEKASY